MRNFLIPLISVIGIFFTGILIMPAKTKSIIVIFACCLIVSAAFVVFRLRIILPEEKGSGRDYIRVLPFAFILSFLLMRSFYCHWLPSNKIAAVAFRLDVSTKSFLIVIVVALAVFSAFFQIVIFARVKVFLTERFSTCRWWGKAVTYFMIAMVVILQLVQLEYSAINDFRFLIQREFLVSLVNIWGILAFNLFIVLIVQSWKVSLIITSSLFFIWSIVDYYVILFHGSPMFFSELVNIRTAFDVAGGYRFPLDLNVIIIVFLFIYNLIFSIFYIRQRKEKSKFLKRLFFRGVAFLVSCAAVYMLSIPIIKKDETWIPWQTSISRIGFLMCSIEDIQKHMNAIKMPEGYSVNELESYEVPKHASRINTPDIILILNESFCDLGKYAEINADVDYMADFYSVSEASFGYAIVSNIGGGTNNSEEELLFSRSMMLLQSAPFTYLNNEVNYL